MRNYQDMRFDATRSLRRTLFTLFALLCCAQPLRAELPPINPQLCVGFYGDRVPTAQWTPSDRSLCPSGTAIYGMLSPSGSSRFAAGKRVVLRATCCPLPASDILTNEHIVAEQSCPENFVATGAMRECPENVAFEDESSTCSYPLRCTKLNMTRYQLGRREPGVFWGTGATFWKESKTILKSDIPLAIRLAMGRINKFSWVQSGCLGSPSGSLFVEKQSKRCHGMIYQQLLFRGLPGDPAAGTPVPMYPQCDTLNHKYSSQPECIVYKRDEVDQVPRVSDDMGH